MLFRSDNVLRKNPCFPYWHYDRFQLSQLTEDECKAEFRFGLAELQLLKEVFQIPPSFVCRNGTIAGGMEGLCVWLRRFAYPW